MVFRSYAPETKIATVRMAHQGLMLPEIQRLLGASISPQLFRRWLQLFQETRCVIRDPNVYEARGRPSFLTRDERNFMVRLLQAEPCLFLDEIQERLYDSTGVLLSTESVHRNLVECLSITLKKPETKNIRKSLVAKYTFMERMEYFPAEFLVFIDESTFCDRDLLQSFARSKRGSPAARFVINQNPERLSLLPAISIEGLLAITATKETFNGHKFEHFLEFDLLPRMNRYPDENSVLVCDNAAIHRGDRVRSLCNEAGVQLFYLPPYCPELNPIELGFASIKQQLRSSQELSSTRDPEWPIRRIAAEVMTSEMCHNAFKHCGYCVPSE